MTTFKGYDRNVTIDELVGCRQASRSARRRTLARASRAA
jgi:hypothetical protein